MMISRDGFMQKGFSVLIFILIVALAGVGIVGGMFLIKIILLNNPQPLPVVDQTKNLNPASGWKVYKNNTLGIELNYPENWTFLEGGERVVTFYPPGVSEGTWEDAENILPGGDPQINFMIIEKSFAEADPRKGEHRDYLTRLEQVKVGEVYGNYYRLDGCAPVCPTFFDLPFKENFLQFELIAMGKENIDNFNQQNQANISDATEEVFRQMILSVKMK